ncbi:hypothetical protein ABKV19_001046 [Rosa sericea]
MSSTSESHCYFSRVLQRETIEYKPSEEKWLPIRFYLIKQTRCWNDKSSNYTCESYAAGQTGASIRHSYSDHRRGYTAFMTHYLSEIGVPRLEHSTILDKIFQVVRSASPQRTILVLVADITVPAIDTLVRKNPSVCFNLKYWVDGELHHETHTMRDVDYHGSLTVESFGAVPSTAGFVHASTKPMRDYHKIGSHGTAEFVELDSTPLRRFWPSDMYRISKADQEEDDDSSSSEDEVFEPCEVCLKDNAHWKFDCPYLVCIPNAKDVTLGNGYDLFCKGCPRLGVHAAHRWKGRAVRKNCGVCHEYGQHWSSECPKRPNPKPFGLLLRKLTGEPED